MSDIEYSSLSCGTRILSAIENLDETIQAMAQEHVYDGPSKYAFVVFSDRVRGPGTRLAAQLRKARLGKVTSTEVATNPNTRHRIQVHVWQVDWRKVKPMMRKHIKKYQDERGYWY